MRTFVVCLFWHLTVYCYLIESILSTLVQFTQYSGATKSWDRSFSGTRDRVLVFGTIGFRSRFYVIAVSDLIWLETSFLVTPKGSHSAWTTFRKSVSVQQASRKISLKISNFQIQPAHNGFVSSQSLYSIYTMFTQCHYSFQDSLKKLLQHRRVASL